MLIVTGSITARPETIDEVLVLSLEHVHRSRLEPGCLLHSVHRDVEHPLRLVFVEHWADADALRTHFRVPASNEFVTRASALAAEPAEIAIYESTPATLAPPRSAGATGSVFEGADLRAVRPYVIVGDADAAIAFYGTVFGATELERHSTPSGGVGHTTIRIGTSILELGEHSDACDRAAEALPRVGLRLYVADVDATYDQAIAAGATGTPPNERLPGIRGATIHDPFGLTWWLAQVLPT